MSRAAYRLTLIHRSLADAIAREMHLPTPSVWRLLRLKKLRLIVKARLAARMRQTLAA